MRVIRELSNELNISLELGANQTPTYRTAAINNSKFGTINVVIDVQHDTKTIELFVPLDKKDMFKTLLDNIDLGYKHKANGLQFTFDRPCESLITKVKYYIKKLS